MTLLGDIRTALRALRRRPAFTALAAGILAVGIGANTAVFSVVDAVLLRALPYRDADALVVVFADGTARNQASRMATTAADYLDWREGAAAFAGVAALRNQSRRLSDLDTPVVPLVQAVSANYFDVLGARLLLGRGFREGEDAPGRGDVAVLSYALWQGAFGGDPGIVGRTIGLDGRAHTVVGVTGPEYWSAHFIPVQPGLWVPEPFENGRLDRTTRDVLVYARLAPGRSLDEARAAMTAISARLAEAHPETNDRWGARLVPIREQAVGAFSQTGAVLLAAVALVLLIACANVANLTLARASERATEVAMRTALGARRGRIVAQLLTESLVLSLLGGLAGAAVASFAAGTLAQLVPTPAGVPFLDRVALDGRVLAFTFALSVVSGLLFGLAPARSALRLDLVRVLRPGGRGSLPGGGGRLRQGLVVAEVALAVVIVSAAGLLVRSVNGLDGLRPGFDADRILKLRTSLRGEAFATPQARIAHFQELKRRLEAVPGVARASAVTFEPPPIVSGAAVFGAVRIALPDAPAEAASTPSAVSRAVLPDYFETMGIPVLSGRAITGDDTLTSRRVAVISAGMARRHFPGVDPLGRTFAVHGPDARPMEVVGVVGDVISAGLDPAPQPSFYVPYAQSPLPAMSVVMRVPEGDPARAARDAERVAWSLSGSTNVYSVETLSQRLADLNWRTRFGALLLGGFAALALLLGAAGLYAVISYGVAQRRGEIGLRMALGARARDVIGMILGGGLRLVALGLVAGVAASLAATRLLSGLLYGVAPGDPLTLAAVAGLLLLVATAACLGPAWRASRVDPQLALRE